VQIHAFLLLHEGNWETMEDFLKKLIFGQTCREFDGLYGNVKDNDQQLTYQKFCSE